MKKVTLAFMGLVAGALLFIGAQGVSTASGTSTQTTGIQPTTAVNDQRLASLSVTDIDVTKLDVACASTGLASANAGDGSQYAQVGVFECQDHYSQRR